MYRGGMPPIIDRPFAHAFASEWVAAWNSGDLERVRIVRGSACHGGDD